MKKRTVLNYLASTELFKDTWLISAEVGSELLH